MLTASVLLWVGCVRAPDAPPPTLDLIGEVQRASGGRLVFTDGWSPRLRAPHGVDGLTFVWTSTAHQSATLATAPLRPGWWSLSGSPPPGDGRLEARRGGVPVWEREVRWLPVPDDVDRRIDALVSAGCERGLAEWRAWSASPRARLRVAYGVGDHWRHRGQSTCAARWWAESGRLAEGSGLEMIALYRWGSVAYVAIAAGRFAEAQAHVDRAQRLAERVSDPVAGVVVDYYAGLLADHRGEHLRAQRILQDLLPRAEAVGEPRLIDATHHALGETLRHLGRYESSLVQLRATPVTSTVSAALRDTSVLLTRLEANLSGVAAIPWEHLRVELEAMLPAMVAAEEPQQLATTYASLIQVALEAGRPDRAATYLDALDALDLDEVGTSEWNLARYRQRIAWALGRRGEAVRAVRDDVRSMRADPYVPPLQQWLMEALLVEFSLHRDPQDVLPDVVELLDRGDRLVYLAHSPQARTRLLARRRALVRAAVDRLVGGERLEMAMALLDRDNATVLESVEQQVRVDAAPEPWRAYAAARAEAERRRAEGCAAMAPSRRPACLEALASAWRTAEVSLDRFYAAAAAGPAAAVRRDRAWARHLQRSLPTETALMFPFSWRGAPAALVLTKAGPRLCAQPIEACYRAAPTEIRKVLVVVGQHAGALDLAASVDELPAAAQRVLGYLPHAGLLRPRAPGEDRGALAVVDPDGSLPTTRAALASAAEQMPALEALVGGRATPGAVLARLERVDDFYFLGHASGRPLDPWSTRLRLAGGTLGVEELLRARPRLDVVLLHGCATAGEVGRVRAELASSFLQVGARAVLGTTEPVAHEQTRAFVEAFVAFGGFETPGRAYRRAVQARFEAGDDGWRRFRLWLADVD